MTQKTALNILKSGKNVFLTGSAGAGKTYVLNQYIEYLRDRGVPLAITASTGIAATHIGGQTIHSWSGLGIRDQLTDEDLRKMAKKKPLRERITKTQVLIIDEISMLSRQTLACIDQIMKYFKVSFEPFGGVQLVFSGDFFQLPPVSRERLSSQEKFAFMDPVWLEANLNICYITESYRHDDSPLLRMLNEIRSGEVDESTVDLLNEKLQDSHESPNETSIKLYTHNKDVDAINYEHLDALDSKLHSFEATTFGIDSAIESLKRSVLAPEFLELKQHAQVMFVKNNYEAGYLNGTMGTVLDFDRDGFPIVETFEGVEIVAKPADWSIVDEDNEPVASFIQIPLRLAWAITVHKSQGMTLDSAEIDLSKTFEPGQGYVALSRVKSWGGLTLLGCNQRALQMDELAMRADVRFQALSEESEEAFEGYAKKELQKMFDDFILKSGGTLDEKLIEQNREEHATPKLAKPKEKKVPTREQTKVLIEEGKSLEEIAEARDLTINTIVGHLEKLVVDFPDLDLSKLKPDQKQIDLVAKAIDACMKNAIEEDLDTNGRMKLGLIHRELGGKMEYEEIRLCRVFVK